MGGAVALLMFRDPYALFVDDPKDIDPHLKGFSRTIFRKIEWPVFKMFCNQFGISHADTCRVFKRFLQYEEVYLLEFQVRTKDVKNHFAMHSTLEKEIADALVPLMFMKDFPGLEPPQADGEVISFARFIIMSYTFCTSQIPDMILDFIAILRRRFSISVNTNLHAYTLEQLMKVMVEDLQPSAAGQILACSLSELMKEEEMSMLIVVKLGIKYPILFYAVERFRKHIRRLVFGDKFWAAHTYFRSRINELEGNASHFGERYKDEQTALTVTSRSIIADVVTPHKRLSAYRLQERDVSEVLVLDEEGLKRLKDLFGYERSRQLIVDSGIGLDCDSKFVAHAFGQAKPLPRPARGVQVFQGSKCKDILELSSDGDEHVSADGAAAAEEGKECSSDEGEVGGTLAVNGQAAAAADSTRSGAPRSRPKHGSPARSTSDPEPGKASKASVALPVVGAENATFVCTHTGLSVHGHRVETVLDAQLDREFRYDPETGKSAWVHCAVDADGDVVLETCY